MPPDCQALLEQVEVLVREEGLELGDALRVVKAVGGTSDEILSRKGLRLDTDDRRWP